MMVELEWGLWSEVTGCECERRVLFDEKELWGRDDPFVWEIAAGGHGRLFRDLATRPQSPIVEVATGKRDEEERGWKWMERKKKRGIKWEWMGQLTGPSYSGQ
jgi:hypothetical protein